MHITKEMEPSLNIELDSTIVGIFRATTLTKEEGAKAVCYNCLKYLCNDPKFRSHFTCSISDLNFSILNSIC